jgi:hypothetical protein
MRNSTPIILPITDNLRAVVRNAQDNPRAVVIHIQARDMEESVGFHVKTGARIVSYFWELPQLRGGNWLTQAEDVLPDGYRLWVDRTFLEYPLVIGLEFETESDPTLNILRVEMWDGTDGDPRLLYLEQLEQVDDKDGS